MAFTTMHFAVGMAGAGGLTLLGCTVLGRGWRYTPLAMTLGGIWAIGPDLPRLFREDFPSLPFASTLGSKALERTLHAHGDWFFLHHMLDAQPKEFALHGLFGILLLYNLAIAGLLIAGRRHKRPHLAAPPLHAQAHTGVLTSHPPASTTDADDADGRSSQAIAGRIGLAERAG